MAVGDRGTQDQLNSSNKNTKGRPPSPSMDDWESGGVAIKAPALASNKWEGEDEETEVLDSWDAEPEEVEEKPPPQPVVEEKKKEKKKSAKKVVERYEERMRARLQAEEEGEEEEAKKELTAEEAAAERLRRRKLEEEADLELAKEIFGSSGSQAVVLDSKEDFERFKAEILDKLESSGATKSAHFPDFAEELVRDLCVTLPSVDLRRLHTRLGNLHIEKAKLEKGDKGKKPAKGKAKAKLKLDGEMDVADYTTLVDDFDDYI